jgi:hypothetical protein
VQAERAAPRVEQTIRAAELVGALSLATDLGTGQPLEHALRTEKTRIVDGREHVYDLRAWDEFWS